MTCPGRGKALPSFDPPGTNTWALSGSRGYLNPAIAFGITSVLLPACGSVPDHAPARPDIVIIMADDMGFSDIGCYGSEIPTPNLDRLAENGIRFTQFYNSGRCCPTRASLLTGLYPHQAGVGSMVTPSDRPGYLGRLNETSVTFAEVLRETGYQTFMSGKWHVTHYDYNDPDPTLHPETWPLQRGFDRFFGTLSGAGSFFSPVSLMVDNSFIGPHSDFYYTDEINDHAAAFIHEADTGRPLLLYVSHVAPHWPLHAKPEHIELFQDYYGIGWDSLRTLRHLNLQEAGIVNGNWPLTPRDEEVAGWEDTPHKDWEAHRMAVYAAQIFSMDEGIGRIIDALESTGRLSNTLIIFLSDNGGCNEIIGGTDTRHGYFKHGGTTPEILPGGPDTYASCGIGWANASNTPFRLYKKWVHEGSIATPLIVHWPDMAAPGRIVHDTGHIIDVMSSLVEISGASYPEEYDGNRITPMEGISFLPLLQERERVPHEALFWEHLGNRAVREGKWKLVSVSNGKWELYDMEADRSEMNDLSARDPAIVERLNGLWEEWAVRTNVK